jgi:virulence factor Mce-like protein
MGGQFSLIGAYRVHTVFATGADLVPGDDVTISGVPVGRVESLSPSTDRIEAVLIVQGQYAPIYNDARAVIRQKNLLGETFVALNRGTSESGPMPNGGTIGEDHTLTPVEIDQVLNTLDPSVRDQLDVAINSLGTGLAGQGSNMNDANHDLSRLSSDLVVLSHTLASNSSHLDALIADLAKIMETLAAYHAQFRAMLADWDHVMQTLASREAALQGTITEQDRVMAILDQGLAGDAPQALHSALAEGPQTLSNADYYLSTSSATVFDVDQRYRADIARLFDELASVMSGIDSTTGRHMWRVTCPPPCFKPQP